MTDHQDMSSSITTYEEEESSMLLLSTHPSSITSSSTPSKDEKASSLASHQESGINVPDWIENFISRFRIKEDDGYHTGHEEKKCWRELPIHKDEDQVALDVNRSFSHFVKVITTPPKSAGPKQSSEDHEEEVDNRISVTEETRIQLRTSLTNVILRILRTYPSLSYYQGYHDIISLIFVTLYEHQSNDGFEICVLEDVAYEAGLRLTLISLRDFAMPSIQSSLDLLQLIPHLIRHRDEETGELLGFGNNSKKNRRTAGVPVWALSPLITLLSHDLASRTLCEEVLRLNIKFDGDLKVVLMVIAELVIQRKSWFEEKLGEVGEESRGDLRHSLLSKFMGEVSRDELSRVIEQVQKSYGDYDYVDDIIRELSGYDIISQFSAIKFSLFKLVNETGSCETSKLEINTILSLQSEDSLKPHPIPEVLKCDSEDELINEKQRKASSKDLTKLNYISHLIHYTFKSKSTSNSTTKDTKLVLKLTIMVGIVGIFLNYYMNGNNSSSSSSSGPVAFVGNAIGLGLRKVMQAGQSDDIIGGLKYLLRRYNQ